jgi:hypothetical protein
MGERTRLSQLRTRHQSCGVGSEGHHYRDRHLSELRLVWADRNTSCRSSAPKEADFSQVIVYAPGAFSKRIAYGFRVLVLQK